MEGGRWEGKDEGLTQNDGGDNIGEDVTMQEERRRSSRIWTPKAKNEKEIKKEKTRINDED